MRTDKKALKRRERGYLSVFEIVKELEQRVEALREAGKAAYLAGKLPDPKIQDDLRLIGQVLVKLDRYQDIMARHASLAKTVTRIEAERAAERRAWLEQMKLISIDLRGLAQEVRYAGIAKELPDRTEGGTDAA